jgi:hypothetical protein
MRTTVSQPQPASRVRLQDESALPVLAVLGSAKPVSRARWGPSVCPFIVHTSNAELLQVGGEAPVFRTLNNVLIWPP